MTGQDITELDIGKRVWIYLQVRTRINGLKFPKEDSDINKEVFPDHESYEGLKQSPSRSQGPSLEVFKERSDSHLSGIDQEFLFCQGAGFQNLQGSF